MQQALPLDTKLLLETMYPCGSRWRRIERTYPLNAGVPQGTLLLSSLFLLDVIDLLSHRTQFKVFHQSVPLLSKTPAVEKIHKLAPQVIIIIMK